MDTLNKLNSDTLTSKTWDFEQITYLLASLSLKKDVDTPLYWYPFIQCCGRDFLRLFYIEIGIVLLRVHVFYVHIRILFKVKRCVKT